jgi:drug/metabolite transporter (DMT)-like permease
MNNKLKGSASIILATVIWGTAFVAQREGMDHIGPFTFQTCRCALAIVTLVTLVWLFDRKGFLQGWKNRKLWTAGGLCGIALLFATNLQQIGLVSTDAGKAGFLTAMYIVLVPVFGIFLKKKPSRNAVISIIPAVAGLYLLSCAGVSSVRIGDFLLIGCAVCFAIQILLVDRYAQDLDCLRLNCVQCIVCFFGSLCGAFTEPVSLAGIEACFIPIAYTGILSLGIAYSLQIVGQKHLEPTVASLLMSLESVFALLGGWLLLHEKMQWWELLGCGLMLGAVILSQLPDKKNI